MRRVRAWKLLGCLAVAALTASGCSGSKTAADSTGGSAAHDTLRAMMSTQLDNLSPLTTGDGKPHVFSLVGAPLLFADPDGKVQSQILQSWDIAKDAKSVTLVLKPDLKWSDGSAITSADVLTTLNIYLDSKISIQAARIAGVAGQDTAQAQQGKLPGVTAKDERTVVVQLEKPDVAWPAKVAILGFNLPLLPDQVLGKTAHDKLADDAFFKSWPLSSGPFELKKFTPKQSAEFDRNDNWVGGKPAFAHVTLAALSTDAALARLRTGEIDFISPVDPADTASLKGIATITLSSHKGTAPETLGFNNRNPKLKDPRIRQAMIYAIDRESICKEILAGECSVPLTNIRQVSPDWAIPTDGVISYGFDQAKAKQLLADAGWDPNTEVRILTRPGVAYVDKVMTAVQGQLTAAGIKATLVSVDTGKLLDTLKLQDDSWEMFYVSGADFSVDPAVMQPYASCKTRYPDGANTSQYCNEKIDPLWGQGLTETDQTKRATTYQDAYRQLNHDPNELYMYVLNTINGYGSHVKGVKTHGNLAATYWNIGEWSWSS